MQRIEVAILALLLASPTAAADALEPASVLVYPTYRNGQNGFTIVNVTNTNLTPITPFGIGGTTAVEFEWVDAVPAMPSMAPPPIAPWAIQAPPGRRVDRGAVQAAAGRTQFCRVFNRIHLLAHLM